METLLIWFGSGFAFSAGIMVGVALMARAARDKNKNNETEAKMHELLQARNEIGIEQVSALERIADALEKKPV